MERDAAFEWIESMLDVLDDEVMPVPVREVWVYGDLAIGLDPIDRLDVYLTKDILMRGDDEAAAEFENAHGVKGVGRTVRTEWAREHPEYVATNENGYAAPERCLAAHLLDATSRRTPSTDERTTGESPVHFEVCNASFDANVTQRLKGALSREAYGELLDPRGVCLWLDGRRDEEALERLREGSFAMPTLSDALGMIGADPEVADAAARTIRERRREQSGSSVRGDVV
ncbi:hypothetical protein AArcSl_1194 [Halalkaliarchaeum desulfuricum]|uniref:Uncharacterized protein n=1 Tax=Halalkaliarchaeum desulfuricum TaxID=2055893 RepID=A0A343TIA5_9EURY|nr:hypothetical protein [Halalkaliarchaeum desulfuricum]AUX08827.1 hypothetical protein AArcSl_1194 [Halalkaliarchaeum desulfuricum]